MLQKAPLEHECFRVIARNIEDGTYFVGCIKPSAVEPEDFCWCATNQPLNVGQLIHGYLFNSLESNKIPLLLIMCN
ncbi:MAG: hypothetical protein SAK29_22475 [Scytonema sp. PMC 1069.18]|nr:hypothetical protein [Scytonema sp. PMC 1069.18]MEC4879726.1 hypothetical protein [Scytonema sp. PMC 1070.18]